ncbi:hypothetical protein I79_003582 [Cricetulus griseus]|uniref:Uncharacterized protein n=1 Tax=Cricetulus griseus TaxID=10029 RepID=G3H0C7_CRIGR|nr:hypothetical protein I79_003582 [Cricetulus griseus]
MRTREQRGLCVLRGGHFHTKGDLQRRPLFLNEVGWLASLHNMQTKDKTGIGNFNQGEKKITIQTY